MTDERREPSADLKELAKEISAEWSDTTPAVRSVFTVDGLVLVIGPIQAATPSPALDVVRLGRLLAEYMEKDGRYTGPLIEEGGRFRRTTPDEFARELYARLAEADREA